MKKIFNNKSLSNQEFQGLLETIMGDTKDKVILDLCSHHAPITSKIPSSHTIFVDYYDFTDEIEKNVYSVNTIKTHTIKTCDITEDGNLYDLIGDTYKPNMVICLDGIEHISKEDGAKLLSTLLGCCCHSDSSLEKMIFFTPLGELWLNNPEEEKIAFRHKSGWVPEDLNPLFNILIFPEYHPTLNFGAWFFWFEFDEKNKRNSFNSAVSYVEGL